MTPGGCGRRIPSPALGGGGSVLEACWYVGIGTAPGCGGGGLSDCAGMVLEGAGGGGAAKGVGAGAATAPGRACGYVEEEFWVVVAGVVVVGVCCSDEVCGVTPSALLGMIGSFRWTGMGGIVLIWSNVSELKVRYCDVVYQRVVFMLRTRLLSLADSRLTLTSARSDQNTTARDRQKRLHLVNGSSPTYYTSITLVLKTLDGENRTCTLVYTLKSLQ